MAIFFLLGCTAVVVRPTGLGNFDKKFLANLASELLTHSATVPITAEHNRTDFNISLEGWRVASPFQQQTTT